MRKLTFEVEDKSILYIKTYVSCAVLTLKVSET